MNFTPHTYNREKGAFGYMVSKKIYFYFSRRDSAMRSKSASGTGPET